MKTQDQDKATASPLQYAILNGVEYSPCKAQPDTQELADASARLMIFHGNRINPESRMWIAPLGEFSSGWVIGTHAKQLVDKEANATLIVQAVNERAALVAVVETDMTETLYAEYCAKSPDVNSASFEMIQAGMKQHRANVANLAAVREGKAQ